MRFASFVLLPLFATQSPSQTQAPVPTFEVASIKKIPPAGGNTSFEPSPDRLTIRNATLRGLIVLAYHVRAAEVTGPAWIDEDRFEVNAKTAAPVSRDDLRLMLRQLLADRFKLTLHTSEKAMRVYSMTLDKGGAKLPESQEPGELVCDPPRMARDMKEVTCHRATTAELAEMLPGLAPAFITLPVLDNTGLKGRFEVSLAWAPAKKDGAGGWNGGDDPGEATVAGALRRLGLKLRETSAPRPVIVIDHADRIPTEN